MNIGQGLQVGGRPVGRGDDLFTIWVATLDAVALPLYVIYSDGRLVFANSAAKACLLQGRWLQAQAGRIDASLHHNSAPSLGSALDRLRRGEGSTVLLTSQVSGCQAVVTVAPVPLGGRCGVGAEKLGLMWVTAGDAEIAGPVKRVAQLFNLTRAEQHVLAELATGAGVREAAIRLEVSIHTVRNQLKSILNKTGRRSQVQLLTLLTRMGALRLVGQD